MAGGVVGAAMDAGDGSVWAVGHDNVLRRFDARTTELTATADIPEMGLMPNGVDLAYGGSTVWVTVADGGVRHLDRVRPDVPRPPLPLHGAAGGARRRLVRPGRRRRPGGDHRHVARRADGGGRRHRPHRGAAAMASAGIAVDGDRAWVLAPDDGVATVVWTRTGALLATAGVPVGAETMVPTAEGGVWAAVPSTGELVQLRFAGSIPGRRGRGPGLPVGGDTYSKCPASGTSQPLPSVKPQRAKYRDEAGVLHRREPGRVRRPRRGRRRRPTRGATERRPAACVRAFQQPANPAGSTRPASPCVDRPRAGRRRGPARRPGGTGRAR